MNRKNKNTEIVYEDDELVVKNFEKAKLEYQMAKKNLEAAREILIKQLGYGKCIFPKFRITITEPTSKRRVDYKSLIIGENYPINSEIELRYTNYSKPYSNIYIKKVRKNNG